MSGTRRVWDWDLYGVGMKWEEGDFLMVVSSDAPTTILEDYAHRWEIETWFGCLKRRGFCFEDTHLTHGERINKLLALLALAFTWAPLTGEWLTQHQPFRFKKLYSAPSKVSSVTDSTFSETLSSISMKSSPIFSSS